MFRHRPALIGVAVFAVVAVVTALVVLGGSEDPREVWAGAAEPICAAHVKKVSAMEVAGIEDQDALDAQSAEVAAALNSLADSLEALDAPGSAAELAEVVVGEARSRAELYTPEGAGGGSKMERISGSLARVRAALDGAGAPSCAIEPVPGSDGAEATVAWLSAGEEACAAAERRFVEADRAAAAGELTVEEYLVELRWAAVELHAGLEATGEPPSGDPDGTWAAMVGAVEAFAAALDADDQVSAFAHSKRWSNAAELLGVTGCENGVGVDQESPSGVFALPVYVAVPEGAVVDGEVHDAERFATHVASTLSAGSWGVPSSWFGLSALATSHGVGVVDAATSASPSQLAVSPPAPQDPDGKVWERNPYEWRFAVRGADGGCVTVKVWGADRVAGFRVVDSNEACNAT